jgi:hypothetical protein
MAMFNPLAPNETDRVRRNTEPETLARIDERIEQNIRYYATQPSHVISRRIEELDEEWSMERWLETNASSIGLTSLLLGATISRKWLLITGGVLAFLLLHATEGWCPPVPVMRRLGIRTRGEIEREKYALKFLRGDFQTIPSDPEQLKKNPVTEMSKALRV